MVDENVMEDVICEARWIVRFDGAVVVLSDGFKMRSVVKSSPFRQMSHSLESKEDLQQAFSWAPAIVVEIRIYRFCYEHCSMQSFYVIYIRGHRYFNLPIEYRVCNFPFPTQRKFAISVADAMIVSPMSMLSPPYGSIFCACEALAVVVAGDPVPVPVLALVDVAELEVAAAVAGRDESFASV